jgi:uncharacterized membrane protein
VDGERASALSTVLRGANTTRSAARCGMIFVAIVTFEVHMKFALIAATAAVLAFASAPAFAQTAPAAKKAAPAATPMPKAGPGEKVCRHKFPSGEARAWVCKSEEPCCAWDEIKYVKCGSTVFKCL